MSTQLSYDDQEQAIIQELQKYTIGVLATAHGNLVSARSMMLLSEGLTISFFTANSSRKFKQISANNNVALAMNNIQIEGLATIKGHTSDPKNSNFLKAMEKNRPDAYKFWHEQCLDPNTPWHLIEIFPKRIAIYIVNLPEIYHDVLDIDKKTAIRYFAGEEYE